VDQFEHKAFYSPTEVAAILGVSHSYVTQHVHDGLISAIRVSPRVTRIPYATLMALLERPLPIRRFRMSPADIDGVSRSLQEEDVPALNERFVTR